MRPSADAVRFFGRSVTVLPRLISASMGGTLYDLASLKRRPSVSVVIPCYNYGHYLEQCLGSVLTGQDGVDIDVILIDDKSTDNSLQVALSLAERHPQISLIVHPVNMGAIATYNEGLAMAGSDYVVLLSADDLLAPGALRRAAQVMEMAPSVGLVYGVARTFQTQTPRERHGHGKWILWPGQRWLGIRCCSGYNVVSSPEVMMRTALLAQIGLYRADLPHAGDFEMWLRAATVADVGFIVGADQAYYRKHAANMHKVTFKSGTHQGELVDLRQRWQAFEAALGANDRKEPSDARLLVTARHTIARHAMQSINYAFARGLREFPIAAYQALAREAYPGIGKTSQGRALARRKRLGMISLPLPPLWAPSAVLLRLTELLRRLRRFSAGV